jgi:anti-sigma B factor antagonist
MEITFREVDQVTVVSISGSVDGLTAEDLLGALGTHVRSGRTRLVADFAEVDYTSSAGLRALLTTMKEVRQRGGDFRLAAVRAEVHRVLELSGFTSILKLYGDVDSAVASYAH